MSPYSSVRGWIVLITYDSLTPADGSLADFVGTGTRSLFYFTSSEALGNPIDMNAVANFTTTEHVTVTLYYCDPGLLSLDLLAFTAQRRNDQVDLTWPTDVEQTG